MNTLFSTFARKVASIVSVLALLCAATLSFTSVVVLGQASPPTAVITVETGAPYSVNGTVFLNGYASTTSTGAAYNNAGNLTFAWQLTRPAGSTSLLAPTASSDRVSFVADVAGTFTAQLVVTDTQQRLQARGTTVICRRRCWRCRLAYRCNHYGYIRSVCSEYSYYRECFKLTR